MGTVRFATRPPSEPGSAAASTQRPHGYWMVDDRGTYLWYRFVEEDTGGGVGGGGGQYVRESGQAEDGSSDDRLRDRLTWTGVGRYRRTSYGFVSCSD